MKRLPLKGLDTAGAVDGDVPAYNAATDRLEYAAPRSSTTHPVPLTTKTGSTPDFVWDANDELVLTEVTL